MVNFNIGQKKIQILSDHCVDRAIVIVGKWKLEGLEATMINVYAPNAITEQRVLWSCGNNVKHLGY